MDDETEDMGYLAEEACLDLARGLLPSAAPIDRKVLVALLRRFMWEAKKGASS